MAAKKSPLLLKLESVLSPPPVIKELEVLLQTAQSPGCFAGAHELSSHLTEGAILSINRLGARALAIPSGEYMVMAHDADRTLLVPLAAKPNEVFEQAPAEFDVLTADVLNNWNKMERVLAETDPQSSTMRIQTDTVDRMAIVRAMEKEGHTVTSLAKEVGVDPPAVSRILREPQSTTGEPGGRNPSIELLSKICNALHISPSSAFPDVFSEEMTGQSAIAVGPDTNLLAQSQQRSQQDQLDRDRKRRQQTLKPQLDALDDNLDDISSTLSDESERVDADNQQLGQEVSSLKRGLQGISTAAVA